MSEKSTDNWLVHDHRRFEETVRQCETAAGAEDWKSAVQLFNSVSDDLKLHIQMEDEVIYPFFKQEVEDPDDDIGDLMYEHDNLERLLNDLAKVIKNRNFDHFESSLEPLYEAMLEHNAHEEEVLKRMGNEPLLTNRDKIIQQLESIKPGVSRNWEF